MTVSGGVYNVSAANLSGSLSVQGWLRKSSDTTPPTVTLTAPNGGTLPVGGQMTMTATASDASGISYCGYYLVQNSTVLGTIYQDSGGGDG